MTLADTQSSILLQAAQHPDGLVVSPAHLPPGPRASLARALLNAELVARREPSDSSANWKLDGGVISLTITAAGREAIGETAGIQANEALPSASGVEGDTAGEAGSVADNTVVPSEPLVTLTAGNSGPSCETSRQRCSPAGMPRPNASPWGTPSALSEPPWTRHLGRQAQPEHHDRAPNSRPCSPFCAAPRERPSAAWLRRPAGLSTPSEASSRA